MLIRLRIVFIKPVFLLTSYKANENVIPSNLNTEISDDDDDNIPLARLFSAKANSVTFAEYMSVDYAIEVCKPPADLDIVNDMILKNNN